MPKLPEADRAIRRGLGFLEKNQQADGGFISFSSPSLKLFRSTVKYRTTFVPALMLSSLAGLEGPEAFAIREELARFLLRQKDADGSFNYWSGAAPEKKAQPYPNDLDDTFCALAGLYLHDPAIIDESVLAKAIRLLLATEVSPGGPYRTWLVPPDSAPVWLDVDVAVNSNVAYFLSLVSDSLPKLDGLMGQAIASDDFSSPYYPSEYALIYYFSRSYGGPHRAKLLAKARRLYKAAASDQDRALCLNARIRLGEGRGLAGAVEELLAGQRRDGSWAAAAFCADPMKHGKPYYNGAPALTTAFALEVLGLYSQAGREPARAKRRDRTKVSVISLAKTQCRDLEDDLRLSTLKSLGKIADSGNGTEIIDLPRRFSRSLKNPLKPAGDVLLETLSLANLYGWLAYTIYDDFLDGEGKPALLPAANAAMRRSLDCFMEALPADPAFQSLVRSSFDAIDGANAWELANCRFERRGDQLIVGRLPDHGDLSKLAERSLGHALPPLAVLAAAGLRVDDASSGQVLRAMRHYLIARQLNDDAHDWPEDLQNGRITPVVAQLLSELGFGPGSYARADILSSARRQFWHATLPKVCRLMRRHVRLSRQALRRSGLLKDGGVMDELLDGIGASVEETLAQQRRAEKFLKHYRRKPAKPSAVRL